MIRPIGPWSKWLILVYLWLIVAPKICTESVLASPQPPLPDWQSLIFYLVMMLEKGLTIYEQRQV